MGLDLNLLVPGFSSTGAGKLSGGSSSTQRVPLKGILSIDFTRMLLIVDLWVSCLPFGDSVSGTRLGLGMVCKGTPEGTLGVEDHRSPGCSWKGPEISSSSPGSMKISGAAVTFLLLLATPRELIPLLSLDNCSRRFGTHTRVDGVHSMGLMVLGDGDQMEQESDQIISGRRLHCTLLGSCKNNFCLDKPGQN